MFRESLIETSHATVVQRGWATLMSFGLEMAAIAVLLVMPMLFTQVVPALHSVPSPPVFTSISRADIENAIRVFSGGGDANGNEARPIYQPNEIPATINLREPRRLSAGTGGGSTGSCRDCIYDPNAVSTSGNRNDVLPEWLNGVVHARPALEPPEAKAPVVVKKSHMDPGMLITKVEPPYPFLAKQTRVQGEVVIAALIDTQGHVVNVRALSGSYLLVPAALSAVREWRYRPTFLNGQAVEVETQIIVNFKLDQQ